MADATTDPTPEKIKLQPRFWGRKLLRLLIWLVAALIFYLLLSFVSGLLNNHLETPLMIAVIMLGLPTLFIFLLVRLLVRWIDLNRKQKLMQLLLVPLTPLLVFVFLEIIAFGLNYPSYRLFSLGLQMRTERIVGLDKLQDWATAFLQQSPWNSPSDEIDRSPLYYRGDKAIPDFVWQLDPKYVSVVSHPNSKCVKLVYGGGFLHWSITIYPRGSSSPHAPDKWRIPWREGIEFYQR